MYPFLTPISSWSCSGSVLFSPHSARLLSCSLSCPLICPLIPVLSILSCHPFDSSCLAVHPIPYLAPGIVLPPGPCLLPHLAMASTMIKKNRYPDLPIQEFVIVTLLLHPDRILSFSILRFSVTTAFLTAYHSALVDLTVKLLRTPEPRCEMDTLVPIDNTICQEVRHDSSLISQLAGAHPLKGEVGLICGLSCSVPVMLLPVMCLIACLVILIPRPVFNVSPRPYPGTEPVPACSGSLTCSSLVVLFRPVSFVLFTI
jgi:hypothetical protein